MFKHTVIRMKQKANAYEVVGELTDHSGILSTTCMVDEITTTHHYQAIQRYFIYFFYKI